MPAHDAKNRTAVGAGQTRHPRGLTQTLQKFLYRCSRWRLRRVAPHTREPPVQQQHAHRHITLSGVTPGRSITMARHQTLYQTQEKAVPKPLLRHAQ
ncbi:hypothetical protein DQ04_12481000 [Trypanosoma grayi]|uniref:hypothetical protein n=1 Tax=Trypanosoma grayi TaxID=71804 RepID=UPI0004F431BD|nr:hypothetical protein DQ04_12481000 [Trypanosoma grayi]KEG06743.1 hypothetical protein DQ04_12481000 [Trypanosoma grayi]